MVICEIMKYTYVILALVALASAQKGHKKHGQGKYAAAAQYAPSGHDGGQSYQGGSPGGFNSQAANKAVYPLLLSDSRTLNTDGSINFNYAADNGLQQGETVDADGTRRGFYSYPGADGKPITVKYTAGKNGFVAEGAHLPRQPQSAAHNDKDEDLYSSPRGGQGGRADGHYSGGGGGGGGSGGSHYSGGAGQYSAPSPTYSSSHGASRQGQAAFADFGQTHVPSPTTYQGQTHGAPRQAHHGGGSSYSSLHGFGAGGVPIGNPAAYQGFGAGSAPAYAAAQPQHQPQPQPQYNNYLGSSGIGAGAPKTPSYAGAGAGQYNPQAFAGIGAPSGGHMHSAINPYIQQGPAGPYNGNFDLGNGGHFSINFTPGAGQEYNPNQGFPGSGAGATGGSHRQY